LGSAVNFPSAGRTSQDDGVGFRDWAAKSLLWEPPKRGSDKQKTKALLQAIAAFTTHPSEATLWRGHASHHYRLTPPLARGESWNSLCCDHAELLRRTERLISDAVEASRFWRDGIAFRRLTQLEQLEHLQHNGGGTPLLDLTPDPMVALWMACESAELPGAALSNHGLLVGFNVDSRWEDVSDTPGSYEGALISLQSGERVGWAVPPVINDRIVVQRSRFLVSRVEYAGRWHDGISDLWLPNLPKAWLSRDEKKRTARFNNIFDPSRGRPASLPVIAFLIPGALKTHLIGVLDHHYGIARNTVYPDAFGGVSRNPR
jgi:hypothetical protein